MIIKNGLVFRGTALVRDDVYIEDAVFARSAGGEVLDAQGCIVAPGFVDIHIHGAMGTDFCDGTVAADENIAAYLASVGVTSYLGTTVAYDPDALLDVMGVAKEMIAHPRPGAAAMRGINLEGVFASANKLGAMQEKYLLKPDYDYLLKLHTASGSNLRLIDVAAELEGAEEFIAKACRLGRVSLHHTGSNYEQARRCFAAGASHLTHLFNAMTPFGHREPGVIGAASDYAEFVELISDGIHIHPAAIRAAFRWFGEDRVCLISDSMEACGMADGEYQLGGQKVTVVAGKATLDSGTIAGSATPLTEMFRRAVKEFFVPLTSALRACTSNPAQAAGLYDTVGSIAWGKAGDLTILDADTLRPVHCVIGGKLVF